MCICFPYTNHSPATIRCSKDLCAFFFQPLPKCYLCQYVNGLIFGNFATIDLTRMNRLNHLPDEARVWLYAANRTLTAAEQEQMHEEARQFINGWTSHEHKMDAAFDIIYDIFPVLALNESVNAASGCGIDKSVAFFKKLENALGILLFNRLQIEVMTAEGLIITQKQTLVNMLDSGQLSSSSTTFNKQINTMGQLKTDFEIPIYKAWFYPSLPASKKVS